VSTLLANAPTAITNATRLALGIGGFSLGVWCESGMAVALDPEHLPFVVSSVEGQACDIELDICWADHLEAPVAAPDFASGGLWSAFTGATGIKFYFTSLTLGSAPYKAAWFDQTFARGHVVLNRSAFPEEKTIFPLEYPIDELLLMHRLSLGEGVELHALGLADQDGAGYLFLGHSGAGKSTTARLWMSQPGVRMLSDDRIILRKRGEKVWMYGTPWHGDAGVASPISVPLSAIYLLEQSPANQVLPLPAGKAAAELFARAFVPHYLKPGLQFTLRFLDELTSSIPCAIFRFAPTENAVEAIRHVRA
jgi:hypothetical protein